jgi:hypothetical protein
MPELATYLTDPEQRLAFVRQFRYYGNCPVKSTKLYSADMNVPGHLREAAYDFLVSADYQFFLDTCLLSESDAFYTFAHTWLDTEVDRAYQVELAGRSSGHLRLYRDADDIYNYHAAQLQAGELDAVYQVLYVFECFFQQLRLEFLDAVQRFARRKTRHDNARQQLIAANFVPQPLPALSGSGVAFLERLIAMESVAEREKFLQLALQAAGMYDDEDEEDNE